jgi:hypothetical protein
MKIAYKALYHQVLCEKEELLYQFDKLVEENVSLRFKSKAIAIISTVVAIFNSAIIVWIIK